MTAQISLAEQAHEVEERSVQVAHLDEVAETIRDDALALAREKLSPILRSADLSSLCCRPAFFDHFKYGLAAQIANVLAANDPRVLAVYLYDPSAGSEDDVPDEIQPEATLHLLVLVSLPSAGLEAFIGALDRALTASLKELPWSCFGRTETVLDVNLFTEKDVRRGLGYAGLLSAVYTPPIKVWQRST